MAQVPPEQSPTRRHVRVGLIDVGEQLPFDLSRLAERLNREQAEFRFQVLGVMTAAVLGPPTVKDRAYEASAVHQGLKALGRRRECDYMIGVTHVRIEAKPPGSTRFEPYFSLGDFAEAAIVSVHPSMARCRGPTMTMDQYVAYLLMCETLILTAGRDLSHTVNRRCLFDECQDRYELRHCIESGTICNECKTELEESNVPHAAVNACLQVLKWCRSKRWRFVGRYTVSHPLTALSIGTGLGWYTSAFVPAEQVWTVLGVAAVPIVLVGLYARLWAK